MQRKKQRVAILSEEIKIGCARPTGELIGEAKQEQQPKRNIKKEV
jgi:uncharacterized radical SAM superfamily protein